jgi:GNAT superfamily N-acetyltransferase
VTGDTTAVGRHALCAHGEIAWHRLGLAALEVPSFEDEGTLWWRTAAVSPVYFAAITIRPNPRALPGDLAGGRIRDTFGDYDDDALPGWTATPADPWMWREPAPVPDVAVDGLEIDTAVNPDEVWVFERTAVRAGGGDDALAAHPPFSIHGRESGQVPGLRLILGKLDGRPVGTAVAARWAGGVCITGVTVVPEARGRRVGSALTAAALRWAPGVPASLSASALGYHVYERLGFERVEAAPGRGTWDWTPPA